MGRVTQRDTGRLEFTYDEAWRSDPSAFPLSVSLPLSQLRHEGNEVFAFVDGLLPDNPEIRRRWGTRFGVSANNPFSLLEHMGGDCPGALQFLREEELDHIRSGHGDGVVWHTPHEVAELLQTLAEGRGLGRVPGAAGYFSLAGAQPKTALIHDGTRWGTPSGRIPTTHILKPPADRDLPGIDVNEHFCLTLARQLGLPAAASEVRTFNGQRAIVIRRFDRTESAGAPYPVRIHQEDLCQAMGVAPSRKYESEGGPGVREILSLIGNWSDSPLVDASRILAAQALNWIIGGSDAHAKNFAFMIRPGSEITLAPLFDIISVLPYPDVVHEGEIRLAMRIGREYQLRKIGRRQWAKLAEMCDLETEEVFELVGTVLHATPGAVIETRAKLQAQGLTDPVIQELTTTILQRVEHCLKGFER